MFDKIMRFFNRDCSNNDIEPTKNNVDPTDIDQPIPYETCEFKPLERIKLENGKMTVTASVSDLPNNLVVRTLTTLNSTGLRRLILCNRGLAEKLYDYFEAKFFTGEEEEWDELEECASEREILDELFLKVSSAVVKREVLKIFEYDRRLTAMVAEAENLMFDTEKETHEE